MDAYTGGAAAGGDADARALAHSKFGMHMTPAVPTDVMERLPDAPARRDPATVAQELHDVADRVEGGGGGGMQSQADQLYQQARPGVTRKLPPGAAIIQVLSMMTPVRSRSGPAFRVVAVYVDDAGMAARGTNAHAEACREAQVLRDNPACGLQYYVVPTGKPVTLALSSKRMTGGAAAAKASANLNLAKQAQEERAVALRDMVRRGGRAASANIEHLESHHTKETVQLRSGMLKTYQDRLRQVEAALPTPAAPPAGVRDSAGAEGVTEFPPALRQGSKTTTFVGLGYDMLPCASASPLEQAAEYMEPWLMVLPCAVGEGDNVDAAARAMHEGYALANIHQISMYAWVHPLMADADAAPVQGHGDAASDLGLQALTAARRAHADAQTMKEVLGDSLTDCMVEVGGGQQCNDPPAPLLVRCIDEAVHAVLEWGDDPQ